MGEVVGLCVFSSCLILSVVCFDVFVDGLEFEMSGLFLSLLSFLCFSSQTMSCNINIAL